MKWHVTLTLGAALGLAPSLHHPAPPADESAEVLAVVETLFDGMRAADSALVRSAFHREARFVSVAEREGSVQVRVEGVDRFVAAVTGATEEWDERLTSSEVRVDGRIASVWAEYRFYLGGEFSHCGVDSIELVRAADGWKITQLADTRRREPCPELE